MQPNHRMQSHVVCRKLFSKTLWKERELSGKFGWHSEKAETNIPTRQAQMKEYSLRVTVGGVRECIPCLTDLKINNQELNPKTTYDCERHFNSL